MKSEKKINNSSSNSRPQNNDEPGRGETMMLRGADGELREYEVISTRERESVFQKACPVVPVPVAIVCCLLNIVPGLGTWIGVLSQLACHKFEKKPENFVAHVCLGLLAGFFQLILAPLVIGFIWSIRFGTLMIQKAYDSKEQRRNDPERK